MHNSRISGGAEGATPEHGPLRCSSHLLSHAHACIFGWFNRLMRVQIMHANVAMAGVAVSLLPTSYTHPSAAACLNESGCDMAAWRHGGGSTSGGSTASTRRAAHVKQPSWCHSIAQRITTCRPIPIATCRGACATNVRRHSTRCSGGGPTRSIVVHHSSQLPTEGSE